MVYYQNIKSNISGFITVVSNRIGDVFIIIFVTLMLVNGLTRFWGKLFSDLVLGSVLAIGVLIASITKSALFPYCT